MERKHLLIVFMVALVFGDFVEGTSKKSRLRAAYRRINPDTYSDCFNDETNQSKLRCYALASSHSIDGKCNNRRNKIQGAAHTRVSRLMKVTSYIVDDMPVGYPLLYKTALHNNPSTTPVNYKNIRSYLDLSSQEISETVFKSITVDRRNTDAKASLLLMTFGQFIDHDFAQIEHTGGACRNPKCQKYSDFKYPCFSIYSEKEGRCNSFTRSRAACSSKGKARLQVNDITSYLDCSAVYGSSTAKLRLLRGRKGRMAQSKGGLLPIDKKATDRCIKTGGCFLAGDTRVNENFALASMHTIWVRFHNYIADGLRKIHRYWSSNHIFFTARKIVIAVFQHIVYREWLPLITTVKPYTGYKRNVDASLDTEFATSAYRFGHSLIPNRFEQLDKNFNQKFEPMSLQNAFFNVKPIHDHGIEYAVYGLMGNTSNKVDIKFAKDLMEKLFIEPNTKGFQSLMARNIQRGRDHGLPSYFKLKKRFNQKFKARVFEPKVLKVLKKAYAKRNKKFRYVDPFVAGIAEKPNRNKLVGPLFGAMIAHQFEKIRDGDRFFYDNERMFSKRQLYEIKKMNMAAVLCVTLKGIVSVQDNVFEAFNPNCGYRRSCKSRKIINLKAFRRPVRYI